MDKYRAFSTRSVPTPYLFWAAYAALLGLAVVGGGLVGMVFGYGVDLPQVEELQEKQPSVVTYVYADDGRVLGQFALERRVLLTYDQIPVLMREAILAAEDANFVQHWGIDFRRVVATAIKNWLDWERKGASTLTMQLSKLRFTSMEKTWERKIKDVLYAINIEKAFSKEQIFTFYCNQIYMGHGTYGMASAAKFYFQKSLRELTLAETALLAGLIQVPSTRSPLNHPERAIARRNWVLGRMLDLGKITQKAYDTAKEEPLRVNEEIAEPSPAPYFVEWVRQYLERQYPTSEIWQKGLRIYTTINYDMQVAAQQTLRKGLEGFDRKERGWAGPVGNILEQGSELDTYRHPDWRLRFFKDQLVHGLVLEASADSATVRIGSYTARIDREDIAWTNRKRVDRVLAKGDVALFRLVDIDRRERVIEAELDQVPEVQGAAYVIENATGAVKAMVGGYDFELSKFNRATQALRQPGSIFKPFTYVGALEHGFSPDDRVLDSPVTFYDALGRPYEPSNSDGEFRGLITIEQALAQSRNIPTVRLANALGPQVIADTAKRFGINKEFPSVLSLALGAAEVTLAEMVSAFSAFPNRGVRAEPYFIKRVEDRNGGILEETRPRFHDGIMSPDVADQMLELMRSVVESGTAKRALQLNRPLAGKTGTTNDSTDSWFIGCTPQVTAGIWAGHDQKKPLGEKVYGATLALPIWIDFMQEIDDQLPIRNFQTSDQRDRLLRLEVAAGRSGEAPAGGPEEAKKKEVRKVIKVEDIKPPRS